MRDMKRYGIYDEEGRLVSEHETAEDGLEALKALDGGEIKKGTGDFEAYYGEMYYLEEHPITRVSVGKTSLTLKDGALAMPISPEIIAHVLSYTPHDEITDLLVTVDRARAEAYFEALSPEAIVLDAESRTMLVPFYRFETWDVTECDSLVGYKCASVKVK